MGLLAPAGLGQELGRGLGGAWAWLGSGFGHPCVQLLLGKKGVHMGLRLPSSRTKTSAQFAHASALDSFFTRRFLHEKALTPGTICTQAHEFLHQKTPL